MPRIKDFSKGRQAAAIVPEPEGDEDEAARLAAEQQSPEQHDSGDENDPSIAFQKQIDALRKSEQTQREQNERVTRERDEAIARANERDTENAGLRKTTFESQAESIASSMAAASAASQAAQSDLEKAFELGDFKGQADATNRLSKANTDLARLEDGKAAMELQAQQAAEVKPTKVEDPLARFDIPDRAKNWLRVHEDYLRDPRKNAKLQSLHWDVIDEGHEPYSQPYFESIETHLGMRQKEQIVNREEPDDEPQTRGRIVSAPVTRDAPASNGQDRAGRVTLSVGQKEAAKIAGITEKEYAEQLIKLKEHKLNGNYGGAP